MKESNRFLERYNYGVDDLSLNSFLFGECVPERRVDGKSFFAAVRNLLSSMGFNMTLCGFEYLARLAAECILHGRRHEAAAISAIALHFATEESRVRANIKQCIAANKELCDNASALLGARVEVGECSDISGAVELISAIFKIYRNYTTDDLADTESDRFIDFNRLIKHGEQSRQEKSAHRRR